MIPETSPEDALVEEDSVSESAEPLDIDIDDQEPKSPLTNAETETQLTQETVGRTSLGCWRDRRHRAISSYRFRGSVDKCARYAAKHKWSVFAIEFGTRCYTGPNAAKTYSRYGRARNCRHGRGGAWAMNVYSMKQQTQKPKPKPKPKPQKPKLTHLGCFRDRRHHAISSYRFRGSVDKCARYAAKHKWSVFAIEFGTHCYTGPNAAKTYRRYGRARNCRRGRGAAWAMNVYQRK